MFSNNRVKMISAGLILSILTACASTKPKQNEVIESYGSAPLYASIGKPYGNVLSFCAIGNKPDLGELALNNLTRSPAYNSGYLSSERQGVIKLANGLDRKAIFAAYDDYINNINEYKTYHSALVGNYYDSFSRVNKVISIDDKSGLYTNDVDFNSLVKVAVNDIKPAISGNFILGACADYSYIKDAVVKRSAMNTSSVVYNIGELNNDIKVAKDSLTSQTSYYKVEKNNYNSKYNYTFDVAVTVPFSKNEMPVPVKVTIASKNYDKPLFPSNTFTDKNISIELKSGHIKIRNNTDQYIKLLSITTYLNDIVSNYSLKDDQAIELPPHSSSNDIKYDSLVTNSVLDASKIINMTLNLSKSTQVSFGIAAKYRIGEQNIDKTLYTKQKNYSVHDILKYNNLL